MPVAWDRNAPEFGDLSVGDNFQKHNYPFSIMINANGERFVDEGADFRNYTYAKYGRVILMQPGQFCWQVFDKKVLHLLRDEYRIKRITKVSANTLPELVEKLDGVNAPRRSRPSPPSTRR
jgi:tricarballylate dehydrogenase